jgi:hypothetical protein
MINSKNWSKHFDGSNFSMLMAGSSGSGKTQLLKGILKQAQQKYDYIVVLCPSLEFSGDYEDFTENKKYTQFGEYDPDIIREVMETQADIIRRHGKSRCPKVILILDDCLEFLKQHSLIEKVFFKGRHINISPIVLVQKLKGVSTILRVNTRYAVFFRAGNSNEIEHFLEAYTGKRERSKIEEELHEWFKQPYSFLFCDFKNQDFTQRYILGVDGKLEKPIEWAS